MKKRIAARLLSGTGIGRALSAMLPQRGVLVLNYHRVGDGSASPYDRELWSATVDAFDAQIGFLKRHCDVISPSDLDAALAEPRSRLVLVTFDDGYRDNHELAFPVLQAHGVPATFFIATGFIDHPSIPWWDEIAWLSRSTQAARIPLAPWFAKPLQVGHRRTPLIRKLLAKYKSLPADDAGAMLSALREATGVAHPPGAPGHWMDWSMIREMADVGMTIGGHTVHHPVLSRLSPARQREEIDGCAARILAETGRRMEYFAYPVGSRWAFDDSTRACLEAAGVRRAFSYYGGYATLASPRFDVPRVAIEDHVGIHEFKAMARLPQVFCARTYD
ncbi:polysaccharide deacetylase family protein [Luteimonas aestuarii]|uniref:polysaccharide deacetylase family protein n=1 Tax=Luteimonas aestuarii TaxID=453837 RepID=UPI001404B242|nr:polysaccharide deacetylase family protein [Luteimonas aestuarii]